ncbi:MAG: hypothetical protein ACTSO7_06580 [Candidatus Heimdallarchaeota archaeon]
MDNKASETKEKKAPKKRRPFKEYNALVKIAFIISSIALAYAIVYGIIFYITQRPGFIGYIIIDATIIAIALIGLILSSISFSNGFNGYNISGFVFDIIVLGLYIASIVIAIRQYLQ